MTAILPTNIDSTMISCFRSCPQKFYLEFVLGHRPSAVSVDLHAGGCFASALEYIRKEVFLAKKDIREVMPKAYGVFLTQWAGFIATKETSKSEDRVWEAVEDYFRTYGTSTDHLQPHNLPNIPPFEFTFAIPLGPTAGETETLNGLDEDDEGKKLFPLHPSGSPFLYSGRFDMLGVLHGARLAIEDDKTTKSIGDSWSQQWDLRSQFIGYCWACQQSGLDVDTVVVRGVGILKTKISQAEAIKTYSKFLVSRWHEQVRRDLWRMRRAWDEQYWDFNLADACSSYGGCAYRDVCASSNGMAWLQQMPVRRWNPVHKNPVEENIP